MELLMHVKCERLLKIHSSFRQQTDDRPGSFPTIVRVYATCVYKLFTKRTHCKFDYKFDCD